MIDRLTKKIENEERYIANNFKREHGERLFTAIDRYDNKVYNKLGRLEDLEDQIGCPFEVVFKALFNGIYESYIDYGDNNTVKIRHRKVRDIGRDGLSIINLLCGYPECDDWFEYKDYKKTWWLKENREE